MDFFRHFLPLREALRQVLSLMVLQVTKTHKSATMLIVRTLRLTCLILLAFCLQVSARGDVQERVAIRVKNVSFRKVFSDTDKRTNYSLFYNVTMLDGTGQVTLLVKETKVEKILDPALAGQALEYTITDKTIFVKKERRAVAQVAPPTLCLAENSR